MSTSTGVTAPLSGQVSYLDIYLAQGGMEVPGSHLLLCLVYLICESEPHRHDLECAAVAELIGVGRGGQGGRNLPFALSSHISVIWSWSSSINNGISRGDNKVKFKGEKYQGGAQNYLSAVNAVFSVR
jgi:hypothetical protein